MGLGTWFDVVDDVMLQRWHTRHLPTDPAEVLGPDVKGRPSSSPDPRDRHDDRGDARESRCARGGACRTVKRGQALIDSWNSTESEPLRCGAPGPRLAGLRQDLPRLSLPGQGEPLHCLLNNAGVFDMSGAFNHTKDGHESHYGTQLPRPALLLAPCLCRRSSSRAPRRRPRGWCLCAASSTSSAGGSR